MTATCSSCCYAQHGVLSLDDGTTPPICWCHRYAPRPGETEHARWPETRPSDWCSEWAEEPLAKAERIQRMNADNLRRAREACKF